MAFPWEQTKKIYVLLRIGRADYDPGVTARPDATRHSYFLDRDEAIRFYYENTGKFTFPQEVTAVSTKEQEDALREA